MPELKARTSVSTVVVLLAGLGLAGCGGSGGENVSSVTAPWSIGAGQPLDVVKSASLEDADRFCYGADYAAELPNQRVLEQGIQLTFLPVWIHSNPESGDMSYAMYLFGLDGYTGLPELNCRWSTPPPDFANCFVGLGNQERNHWEWFSGEDIWDGVLTLPSLTPYLDGEGRLLLAMVLTGADMCTLSWLRWGGNMPPVAELAADPAWGEPPLTVSFSAEASLDPDDAIVDYEWDLDGDGAYGEPGDEADAGGNVTAGYTYMKEGTYTAGVRVTDNEEAADTATAGVFVSSIGPGAWWMFGRDPQHTHRSPYVAAQTNNVKWSFATGDTVASSPAIGADGTVYVGSSDSKLYAINLDGSFKWSYTTGDDVYSSPAIGTDGAVYVGSVDDKLYAINPDGSLKWAYTTGDDVYSSPTIATDGTVYVGSKDDKLYAINPDGSLKWSYTTGGNVTTAPAVGEDGTVYVASWDDNLYAINPDGSFKWAYTADGDLSSSPAVGEDGTVYVGHLYAKLYALNPDGSFKWSYTAGSSVYSSPAVGEDGTVYVGSSDGELYALNPDGSLKWSYTTGAYVGSSPAIGVDGTVYVGSGDHKVYAINAAGSFKWSYETGGPVGSSPAIGADGTVYVGSSDGKLYAIGPGS